MANPTGRGGFEKGKSGNPTGRPKEYPEVRDLARQHTKMAVERLVHWAKSDDPRASVAASTALIDRGWGKPTQSVEAEVNVTQQIGDLMSEVRKRGTALTVAAG